jgi:cation-transporting ATPase 13A3/4/5
VGPAVDRQAFSAVQEARLLPDGSVSLGGIAIKYLKRFEFDHNSTTQSVIIEHGESKTVFVKGSPEAISKLCQPSSLPENFQEAARHAARNGMYQLAIARGTYTGEKEMHQVQRSDIEKELIFTGCINFQNLMKQESPAVIAELRAGDIEPAMITGDNTLTGIYIAKRTGIIQPYQNVIIGTRDGFKVEWADAYTNTPVANPAVSLSEHTVLAMTGEAWRSLLQHSPKRAMELGKKTLVFGRCTPLDKVSIVSTFVKYGDVTMMCGDGGNDSGALKAARKFISCCRTTVIYISTSHPLSPTFRCGRCIK